jgi:hypothetical protein
VQSSETVPLLDLVYEAAAMPDLWPAVLDRMAGIAGGVGTFLITTSTQLSLDPLGVGPAIGFGFPGRRLA